MTVSQAPVSLWIQSQKNQTLLNILSVIAGSVFLAALAQVAIPLPFTPVPITGQTFGVMMLALFWGQSRAVSGFLLYLGEGALGLPVFAMGQSGLAIGPSAGYLVGMLVACAVVGYLSDRGSHRRFVTAWLSCLAGSVCIFLFGLVGLSFFVPQDTLLTMGLWPFLPGDFIKNVFAAVLVSRWAARR